MKGKICLVTGGSSGVGKAIVFELARLGATIIIASRNEYKAQKVIDTVIGKTGNENLHWMYVDFTEQQSIRQFVAAFKKKYIYLHLLSNNAGIIQLYREETVDGIEKTLAVDFLSHFLVTNLLLDLLKQSVPSRVITVSGGEKIVKNTPINFDNLQFKDNYNGFKAAIQAARARVLFTMELAKRLEGTGVTCNTFQPGMVKSELTNNLPFILRLIGKLGQPFLKNSSKTAVYLAVSEELKNISGKYFKKSKPIDFSYDPEEGKKLWEIGENLIGLRPGK